MKTLNASIFFMSIILISHLPGETHAQKDVGEAIIKAQEKKSTFKTRQPIKGRAFDENDKPLFRTAGAAYHIDPAEEEKLSSASTPSTKPRITFISKAALQTISGQPLKKFFGESGILREELTIPSFGPNSNKRRDIGIEEGTPAIKIEFITDSSKLMDEVFFERNSATLTEEESFAILRDLGAKLSEPKSTGAKFIIEGHASSEGNAAFNKKLSQERAYAIYCRLIQEHSVEPARLLPIGFGEEEARFGPEEPENVRAADRSVRIYKLAQ